MLRITKQTDYGILLLTQFGSLDGDGLLTAKDLSQSTGVPLPMVSKILKVLVRNDLLQSHRGVNGGYALAHRPEETRVVDVISALEGPIAMTECSDEHSSDCCLEASCRVRVNWQLINQTVYDALAKITLAEMTCPAGALAGLGAGARSTATEDSTR